MTAKQFLGSITLAFCLSTQAVALDLEQAKRKGLVGETDSGYIAAIKPSADIDTLVANINSQRKAQYKKIADKNGISLQAVEARAGLKAIEKTPSGELVNTGAGWQKK
ncbi:MAG: YdbL family protein [Halioglobus sp.]|nr:YdbL family protein [Halioglobus sp.]